MKCQNLIFFFCPVFKFCTVINAVSLFVTGSCENLDLSPNHSLKRKSPCSDDTSSNQDSKEKKKKARTTFSGRQIFELEKQFELKKYLSANERAELANLLNVTDTQV